jgi:hypothetical protein
MTTFLNRIFTFLLLVGIFMPAVQAQAVWIQPPFEFPADGGAIAMGSDDAGNAIVVLDNEGTVEAFFYSVLTQTWAGPTILGSNAEEIALSVDPSGTAIAVWLDPDVVDLHSAFFNRFVWTPGTPDPFATGTGTPDKLNLTMNGPNTALLTWWDSVTNTVFSNFFSAGTWSPSGVVVGPAEYPLSSDYSANGTAVASYLDITEAILLVSNFTGGFWQQLPGFTLDTNMTFSSNNAVARIDANGHAAVVWVDNTGFVMSSSYFGDPVVGWTPAAPISTTSGNNLFSVSFDMAPGGTGVATWVDGSGNGISNSYNGTTWGTPQMFATNISDDRTVVTVNQAGNALVLFQTPDITFEDGTILSAFLPLGGVWMPPEFVSTPDDSVAFLIPSLSDDLYAFAAWSVGVERYGYFATVNVLAPPVPVPPAPPASINATFCKDKFAMQTECVTTVTWTPSPTPTVAFYQVFRDGVLVLTVPATGPFNFVSLGNCKKTVYSVFAIDVSGAVSSPATVTVR